MSPLAQAKLDCRSVFAGPKDSVGLISSYNDVVAVMKRDPYDPARLPAIPLRMWKFMGKQLSFFVAKRSKEILEDRRDFRHQGMEKPIHPMGVGLQGKMIMHATRWSGIFAGGEFPVLARASISQGNASAKQADGKIQARSTAMAIKLFNTTDPNQPVKTANAVFQNDLNGTLANDGTVLRYLDSEQTNQPKLNVLKIRKSYEVLTLLGVAFGSLTTPKDRSVKFPYINPQIRPVHSWAEVGVTHPQDVRVPTWVQLRPKLEKAPVPKDDFRLEITETLARDGELRYELLASDIRDDQGRIQWESVGEIIFDQSILSAGVDQNLLFPHDKLNSTFSGQEFQIPAGSQQYRAPYDDVQ